METGYTVNDSKHTSLLEDGFMPVQELDLVNLINTNFTKDDLLVSLTYKNKCKPTLEEAKRDIEEYIKRIKRYRSENGLGELKYFYVIRSKDKRRCISHKILINSMDEKVAEDFWNKGYANAGRLQEGQSIEMIGRYITKDLKDSRYCGSSEFKEKYICQEDTKETAQEVPVQEQPKFVPTDSSGTMYPENQSSIKYPFN